MFSNTFYHGVIRKTIIAFGRLFSDIYIERRKDDSVAGDIIQKLQIPIAYAPKEKWLVRLDQDPSLENYTYTSLPRISFEITGYSYDASRKIGKMNKIICNDGTTSGSIYSSSPWIIDISLYVLTKTQEDGLQIIEQILPIFGPEYTLSIMAIPEMNIVQDIPVILNSVSVSDEYDGDFATRRFVTYTLTFQLKLNLYGPVLDNKPIYSITSNISSQDNISDKNATYRVEGDPETMTITFEGWDE